MAEYIRAGDSQEFNGLGCSTDAVSLATIVPSPRPDSAPEPRESTDQTRLISSPMCVDGYGRPVRKPLLDWIDTLAIIVSCLSCGIACAVVWSSTLSWRLGYNSQLIVIGFALSVMALCLSAVAPTLFLRLEARFGKSALQNYDAIRLTSLIEAHMDWWWRLVLLVLAAIPLALSASYKLEYFAYGTSNGTITAGHSLWNDIWGMYAPPGLLPLGWNSGILLMHNASLPFLQASTPVYARTDDEYDLPSKGPWFKEMSTDTFGFNMLFVNKSSENSAVAMLDAPDSRWLSDAQYWLSQQSRQGVGFAIEISSSTFGTLSRYDNSIDAHRITREDDWWRQYSTRKIDVLNLRTGWEISFASNDPENTTLTDNDDSWCFMALYNTADGVNASLKAVKLFNTVRASCHGTWRVTTSSIQLVEGSCSGQSVPNGAQKIFNENWLNLRDFYGPIWTEYLSRFQRGNATEWLMPTMTSMIAAMYWSRVAAMNGPNSPHWAGDFNNTFYRYRNLTKYWETDPDLNLQYRRPDTIIRIIKPAVQNSPWIFAIIFVLPLLTFAAVAANIYLHGVPIGRGFGSIALLSGVQADTLHLLRGAGFSGDLKRPINVQITVTERDKNEKALSYTLTLRNPSIDRISGRHRKTFYH